MIYWLGKSRRWQNVVLLVACLIIYAFYSPLHLLLLLLTFSIGFDYWISLVNRIDEVAGENETTLLKKAYLHTQHPVDVFVNGNISAFGERQTIKRTIDNRLKYTMPRLLDECKTICVDGGIESIFNLGNIKRFPITPIALDLYQWTGWEWDFDELVEDSFLPDIIEMTRQNEIKFILIREKNARIITYEERTDDMRLYFEQMAVN